MKKYFRVKGLDCAHCAGKLERSIAKVKGVQNVAIDFLGGKIMIVFDKTEYNDVLNEIISVVGKTMSGIVIEEL